MIRQSLVNPAVVVVETRQKPPALVSLTAVVMVVETHQKSNYHQYDITSEALIHKKIF